MEPAPLLALKRVDQAGATLDAIRRESSLAEHLEAAASAAEFYSMEDRA
jgi:hypothetical protein